MIRIRGATAHEAARFVATAFQVEVIVVGGDPEIDLDLAAPSAEAAMSRVASAAGLESKRWGNLFLVGPGPIGAAPGHPKASPKIPPVNLDFYRAPVDKLQKILAEVARSPALVDGTTGEVSLIIRHRPAREIADWIRQLAGDGRALPSVKQPARVDPCARSTGVPPLFKLSLPCAAPSQIDLLALFSLGARRLALVREGRRSVPIVPSRAIDVRVGDRLGDPPARVEAIGDNAIELENKIHLPLPSLKRP